MPKDGLPILAFAEGATFAQWLALNPRAPGAWLKFARKGGGDTLSKAQAIDCALCHGWIDGQLASLDAQYFLTRFTPRRAGSRWSAKNAARAEELLAQGHLQPCGLAEIEAAKADGRWAAAYPSARHIGVPTDFTAALGRSPAAGQFFETLDSANRYALLYRLHHASAAARTRRIDEFVAMLERGETFHPRRNR